MYIDAIPELETHPLPSDSKSTIDEEVMDGIRQRLGSGKYCNKISYYIINWFIIWYFNICL